MRILIVEDDMMSRKLMAAYLQEFGKCDLASNGREALEAVVLAQLEGERYDLVCLDIMMPNMSGQEVLRHIRNVERELAVLPDEEAKVIMTSALQDCENIMGAFREQCDGYLVKPIDKSKLTEMLQELKLVK
jgi:two-component system, chemotaxis family, chemotaxis protein CheY